MKAISVFCCVVLLSVLFSIGSQSQTRWTKHPSNPVLSPGALNGVSLYGITGGFDAQYALSPSVLFDSGLYRMWYVGYENEFYGLYTIGYALSEDGVSWSTYTRNPVLSVATPGNFDSRNVWLSVVIKDTLYKMYYSGYDGQRWKVGLATSTNGIRWTKYPDSPILSNSPDSSWDNDTVYGVSVVPVAPNDYRMSYTGRTFDLRSKIGYATSADGIHWTKYSGNPVLKLGPPGSWESENVYVPRVVYVNNAFHMFYLGNTGPSGTAIGYAFSPDGIHWEKSGLNPVLRLGFSTEWDSYSLIDHCVLFQDNTFKIWYGGRSSTGLWQIGYATSPLTTTRVSEPNESPQAYKLFQSYPNPFNPQTIIEYEIPKEDHVVIKIFNSLGQEVSTLVDGRLEPGHYSSVWHADKFSSGVYWYQMTTGGYTETRKMMLLK